MDRKDVSALIQSRFETVSEESSKTHTPN